MSSEEIRIMANFDKKAQILALKQDEQGQTKIVAFSRNDLSCWDFFLRLFNRGTLANTQVRLVDVAVHLSRYNLVGQYIPNTNSPENAAVLKIWGLLMKASMGKRAVIQREGLAISYPSASQIFRS